MNPIYKQVLDTTWILPFIYTYKLRIRERIAKSIKKDPRFWRRVRRNEYDIEQYAVMVCNKLSFVFEFLPFVVYCNELCDLVPERARSIKAFRMTYHILVRTFLEFPHLKIDVSEIIGEDLYNEIYEKCKMHIAHPAD